MYRQGLGDCFLLTVEETGKEALHMLIDCGLLQGTENGTAIMQQVVADIESKLKQSPYDPATKANWKTEHPPETVVLFYC